MRRRERLLAAFVGVSVYAYAGYPLLVLLVGALRPRPVRRGAVQPTLSVIIAARNEAAVLPRKLDALRAQDYPAERLEVIIASDGSTDATAEVVAPYLNERWRLLLLERGGKAQTLNRAAAAASNDILVFTDANAIPLPDTFSRLVESFADPEVGGVSANERREFTAEASGVGLGERLYWEYDKWLKQAETRVGSMVSASGSMYALRRELFRPIADLAATDDFTISTQVVRAGQRLVFEPRATTLEPAVRGSDVEFGRKVRTTTRGLRSVWGVRDLLSPTASGFYAVELWSHKVVRRLVGFCAVGVYLLSLSLAAQRFYRALFAAQSAFYALALAGWLGQGRPWGRKRWLYIPYYLCLSNLAVMLGVIRFVSRKRLEVWEPRREE